MQWLFFFSGGREGKLNLYILENNQNIPLHMQLPLWAKLVGLIKRALN